ncbi:hypothetical protein [Epilithonimonas xixisoli]|uniref:hypothetical protein n=1 Tax=Epilithonimonas xixisoli TaxID=1476462 RepID=UPI001416F731|nr:hypothetical protein [Epilithonimonas xixisoli]
MKTGIEPAHKNLLLYRLATVQKQEGFEPSYLDIGKFFGKLLNLQIKLNRNG